MGRIYLVRHGEVAWNRANAYVGSTDLPVNAEGRKQAAVVANRLEGAGVSAVYSSDLLRARETAEIIARRLGLAVEVVPELREVNYGEWEGMSEAEIAERYPDLYPRWRASSLDVRIPGGETFGELRDRAFRAFSEIADAHRGGSAVVVAHKSVNRVILCCVLEMDANHYRQIGQRNSAINVIEVRDNGRLVVDRINDCCHLPGPGAESPTATV